MQILISQILCVGKIGSRSASACEINNASNEYHRDLVFDPPARMVGRFENFLRDAARDHAPCCGKGQRIVAPAIFKTFSKNHGIGTRTHAGEEWSQRGSNPRGTAENPCYHRVVYCKYSIFTVELDNSGGSGTSSQQKYTIFTVRTLLDFETHGSRIDPRFQHF